MNKITIFILSLIILLAFGLRFNKVTEIPPSLNWDEVSIGYNAYSVLKTGRDEWGAFLPLHFKSYGEYKLPAQIYASIPGIAIFGLNELGVRVTPVIYGSLTVLLTFFLARVLFGNFIAGLASSFLLAISPWHIQLTRASFESSFACFWIVLGLWFLVKGFKDSKWFILSMIPFAVSIYTYNSARVFVPLFLLAILLIFRKKLLLQKKNTIISIFFFIVLLLPLAPFYFSGEGSARYKLVSITDDPGLIPRINENRGKSALPGPLPVLINNRFTYISFYFGQHYLTHFTPDFLFISGAPHKQHHVQGMGELYWFEAPLLLLGLFMLFKKRQEFRWLIVSWVLLAFIPVSVTNDSIPHALRTLVAIPSYQLIAAFGVFQILQVRRKFSRPLQIGILSAFSLLVIFNIGSYLNNYYNIYPNLYSRDWQYGYKQAVSYVKAHQDEYDQIIFTRHYGEPHMFMLFYLGFDPSSYQNDKNLVRYQANDWVWVLNFNKFYFPNLDDPGTQFKDLVAQKKGKTLYVGKATDFPIDIPRLLSVNFLDGQPVFDVIEQ